MRIVFRVDASNKIGTGHVMRCLTLATKIPNAEFICTEIEGNLIEFIKAKGFKVHTLKTGKENERYCVHSSWLESNWQDDATQTAEIAKGANWLVVDHYAIDERWEKIVRPHVKKIMLIDDLADRKHDCDLLLDQNYYEGMEARYNNLVPANCVKLLGPKYALLRDEFVEARKNLQRKFDGVKKIFVSFGGIDATNETGKVLEKLKDKNYQIKPITGAKNYQALKNQYGNYQSITLLERSSEVAKLMAEADLAIGAGGSTTWERCALGLPTIAWPVADNQVQVLRDVERFGALKISSPQSLLADIAIVEKDLLQYSTKASLLVAGDGALRVVKYLVYNIRNASEVDCKRIYEIRNMEAVREFSNNSEVIPYENHLLWFNKVLQSQDCELLVMDGEKDIAGVLRYDLAGNEALVSVYLNPVNFGNHLGEVVMNQGNSYIQINYPKIRKLIAKIKEENLASIKLFSKIGFTKESEGVYSRNI